MTRRLLLVAACCASVAALEVNSRGGTAPMLLSAAKKRTPPTPSTRLTAARGSSAPSAKPSFYWAVLANWLYFLSLGFNVMSMSFLTRQITDGTLNPSPASIKLSGNIESVDKILTFLGVSLLSSLSDVHGRKKLMAWSALGFGVTNLLQAKATGAATLFLADAVDGISSCMTPVCQAYVADCSPPHKRASNLGIFQGLSIGMAFIIAFPVGGILGSKCAHPTAATRTTARRAPRPPLLRPRAAPRSRPRARRA